MFRSGARWFFLVLLFFVVSDSAHASVCKYWKDLAGKAIRTITRQTTPSENGVPIEWHQDKAPEQRIQIELPEGKTLENTSIGDLFLKQAKADPDRVLLIDDVRGPLTNRDIVAGVYMLKDRIADLSGDNIGVMLPASSSATVTILATQFAGKTPAMLNFTTGMKNVRPAVETAGIQKILTSRAFMEEQLKRTPDLAEMQDRFIYLEDLRAGIPATEYAKAFVKSRLGSWNDLAHIRPPETAIMLFTSGSSGTPKAVPLTHANLIANVKDILDVVPVYQSDRVLGMLPPFHSFGATGNVALPLITGTKIAYYPNPLSGKGVAESVEKYGATVIMGTPTFLQLAARGSKEGQLKTLRVGIAGAERLTEKAATAIAEKTPEGFHILEAYGTTEAAAGLTINYPDNIEPGTIGKLLPSVEGILVEEREDGTYQEVEPGKMGRLLVRGPNLFKGYYNYEGASPFVTVNGKQYYDTGDMISYTAKGNMKYEGRANMDFVKIGGEMVSFQAVIDVLNEKYQVTEANRFVVAADMRGDKPRLVLLTTQKDLDTKAVNEALTAGGLTNIYSINRIVTYDQMPLLGTGKLDKKALKDRAQQD